MTKTYHHIGLIAPDQETPIPNESWVEGGKLWVSDPADHPQRVEWLRYAPDSTIGDDFRNSPHICYTTDDIQAEVAGKQIVNPIAEVGNPPFGLAAFTQEDGILVEYIQLYPGRRWFNDPL